MQFVDMLREYMEPGSYRLCYCDTDSFALTLCEDHIDDCVKPHLAAKYHAEIKPKWFAAECDQKPTCADCRRSQKKPGLLKIEARITSGWLLATSPKCYIMTQDLAPTPRAARLGEMERKIIEFGNLATTTTTTGNGEDIARKLLDEIAQLEIAQGDDIPYKIAKKGAKGCSTKVRLR